MYIDGRLIMSENCKVNNPAGRSYVGGGGQGAYALKMNGGLDFRLGAQRIIAFMSAYQWFWWGRRIFVCSQIFMGVPGGNSRTRVAEPGAPHFFGGNQKYALFLHLTHYIMFAEKVPSDWNWVAPLLVCLPRWKSAPVIEIDCPFSLVLPTRWKMPQWSKLSTPLVLWPTRWKCPSDRNWVPN